MSASPTLVGTRVLVIGAGGLLGSELVPVLESAGADVSVSTSRTLGQGGHLDIRKPDSIKQAFTAKTFDVVVNCAAYTAVDDAERDYTAAFSLNAEAVGLLAEASQRYGFRLVHVSTDYVFGDSYATTPIKEDHPAAPLGIYGLSKWHGELLLRAIAPQNSLVVRTSWLHGLNGKNFIDTMLRLGKTEAKVKVVNDQVGSLTWAPWLSRAIAGLIASSATGVVHASSQGEASWYDVACEVFSRAGIDIEVQPVATREFPRPAPRPKYSVMDTTKLRSLVPMAAFTWKDSITAHLQAKGVLVTP